MITVSTDTSVSPKNVQNETEAGSPRVDEDEEEEEEEEEDEEQSLKGPIKEISVRSSI